jgi:hypothetical protein
MNWQVVSYYVGLAMLVVLLVVALVTAYRVWVEIHDVEEPDSPAELLESFEQAHAAGILDDAEFARVRGQLDGDSTGEGPPRAEGDRRSEPFGTDPRAGAEGRVSAPEGDRDAR